MLTVIIGDFLERNSVPKQIESRLQQAILTHANIDLSRDETELLFVALDRCLKVSLLPDKKNELIITAQLILVFSGLVKEFNRTNFSLDNCPFLVGVIVELDRNKLLIEGLIPLFETHPSLIPKLYYLATAQLLSDFFILTLLRKEGFSLMLEKAPLNPKHSFFENTKVLVRYLFVHDISQFSPRFVQQLINFYDKHNAKFNLEYLSALQNKEHNVEIAISAINQVLSQCQNYIEVSQVRVQLLQLLHSKKINYLREHHNNSFRNCIFSRGNESEPFSKIWREVMLLCEERFEEFFQSVDNQERQVPKGY